MLFWLWYKEDREKCWKLDDFPLVQEITFFGVLRNADAQPEMQLFFTGISWWCRDAGSLFQCDSCWQGKAQLASRGSDAEGRIGSCHGHISRTAGDTFPVKNTNQYALCTHKVNGANTSPDHAKKWRKGWGAFRELLDQKHLSSDWQKDGQPFGGSARKTDKCTFRYLQIPFWSSQWVNFRLIILTWDGLSKSLNIITMRLCAHKAQFFRRYSNNYLMSGCI